MYYLPEENYNGGVAVDYFCFIQAVVSYVENRLKTDLEEANLQRITGFSMAYIREIFKKCTKIPLKRYILYRKISNAAFEIAHSEKTILNISLEYGFETYDTFTRAFKRFSGNTPQEFRKNGFHVGRIKLSAGIFGPGILDNQKSICYRPILEDISIMKRTSKSKDSCILFGVPKVQYCAEECTPFPSTLKACLHYMGQDISYSHLMAASGAAFRLRWNTTCWDGGNVGIAFIYEDLNEAYKRSFNAAGRSYKIMDRIDSTTKEDFKNFIRAEIDEGRPVIALGIIGPPESCIITGYRDDGDTLLGWNFFQENPEFAGDAYIDESGYFISKKWWENPCTIAVMSIGEEVNRGTDTEEILKNSYEILMNKKIGDYAGGQAAFDAWENSILDDKQFHKDTILPLLFERLMCLGDAMDMVAERINAAIFMEWVAKHNEKIKKEALEAANIFKSEARTTHEMCNLLGGWQRGEQQAKRLADPNVRKMLAKTIMKAKDYEARACKEMYKLIEKL